MIFRITNVDMNGFTGRENHPHPSDVGLFVTPVSMMTDVCAPDYEHDSVFSFATDKVSENLKLAAATELDELEPDGDKQSTLWRCWTCITRDGRKLDLMDFEVELFRS